MSLITCPKCGNMISDKAEKCPRCGHPAGAPVFFADNPMPIIENHQFENNVESNIEVQETPKRTILSKKLLLISGIAATVLGITLIVLILFSNNLNIRDIELKKWELISGNSIYKGTIETNEKRPFVVVVGWDIGGLGYPLEELIYVKNGIGAMETYSYTDPSLKYKPIGYIKGKSTKNSSIKKFEYDVSCYNDYEKTGYTNCSFDIKIEMRNKKSGLLFFKIKNDLNNNTIDSYILIANGKGEDRVIIDELPFKSRGVEISLEAQFFCPVTKLKNKDYSIQKAFSVEKGESSFDGSMELIFNKYEENAMVLYTEELIAGGEVSNREKVLCKAGLITNGRCTIETYDYFGDEKMLTPQYEIKIIGCIPWTKLK